MFSRQPHAHEWSDAQRSIATMNVDASKITPVVWCAGSLLAKKLQGELFAASAWMML
jgi:hypothetical protein